MTVCALRQVRPIFCPPKTQLRIAMPLLCASLLDAVEASQHLCGSGSSVWVLYLEEITQTVERAALARHILCLPVSTMDGFHPHQNILLVQRMSTQLHLHSTHAVKLAIKPPSLRTR